MKVKTLNIKGVIAQSIFIFISVVILRLKLPFIQEYGTYLWVTCCVLYTWYTVKFGVDVFEL